MKKLLILTACMTPLLCLDACAAYTEPQKQTSEVQTAPAVKPDQVVPVSSVVTRATAPTLDSYMKSKLSQDLIQNERRRLSISFCKRTIETLKAANNAPNISAYLRDYCKQNAESILGLVVVCARYLNAIEVEDGRINSAISLLKILKKAQACYLLEGENIKFLESNNITAKFANNESVIKGFLQKIIPVLEQKVNAIYAILDQAPVPETDLKIPALHGTPIVTPVAEGKSLLTAETPVAPTSVSEALSLLDTPTAGPVDSAAQGSGDVAALGAPAVGGDAAKLSPETPVVLPENPVAPVAGADAVAPAPEVVAGADAALPTAGTPIVGNDAAELSPEISSALPETPVAPVAGPDAVAQTPEAVAGSESSLAPEVAAGVGAALPAVGVDAALPTAGAPVVGGDAVELSLETPAVLPDTPVAPAVGSDAALPTAGTPALGGEAAELSPETPVAPVAGADAAAQVPEVAAGVDAALPTAGTPVVGGDAAELSPETPVAPVTGADAVAQTPEAVAGVDAALPTAGMPAVGGDAAELSPEISSALPENPVAPVAGIDGAAQAAEGVTGVGAALPTAGTPAVGGNAAELSPETPAALPETPVAPAAGGDAVTLAPEAVAGSESLLAPGTATVPAVGGDAAELSPEIPVAPAAGPDGATVPAAGGDDQAVI